MPILEEKKSLRLAVLISGNGSNLEAIIDAIAAGLPATIGVVISDNPSAYGLERAKQAGIPTCLVSYDRYSSRLDFERALQETVNRYHPELLVLAGFMRKLKSTFVDPYAGRIINIHPSLLPKHPGLNTHRRVLAAGDTEHGASVHFVTDILDGGPLICQSKLSVYPDDTPDTLRDRVLIIEHFLYPKVISWIADNRLRLSGRKVYLDNHILPETGQLLKIEGGARSSLQTIV